MKKILSAFALMFLVFAFPSPIQAQKRGYSAIVNHLKTKYQAKKVKIPFMFLARFAVKVVRPAGVKSFNVTIFEGLKFSRTTLDEEMQAAMRDSLGDQWSPILRVRSRNGEQVYMYMTEEKDNVKIMVVTIDKDQAVVVRAKFNPEKLAEFIDNPKIFGISLGDDNRDSGDKQPTETDESKN
jgi:hypothetical protein